MECDIYNGKGIHVGSVIGPAIFDFMSSRGPKSTGHLVNWLVIYMTRAVRKHCGSTRRPTDCSRSSDARGLSRLWMQCLFVCFQFCNHNFDAI